MNTIAFETLLVSLLQYFFSSIVPVLPLIATDSYIAYVQQLSVGRLILY
jgi:VIT1/CCC1 family predicted Fe2+/Mn2+ transporter